jgi:hypothetical protein
MSYRLEPQQAGNFYMCHSYGIQIFGAKLFLNGLKSIPTK